MLSTPPLLQPLELFGGRRRLRDDAPELAGTAPAAEAGAAPIRATASASAAARRAHLAPRALPAVAHRA